MSAANSGSVGRGKRFNVVDRPARTDRNTDNVLRHLFDAHRPAQRVASARPKWTTRGRYTPHPTTT
jgi:hypothetical protein